MRKVYFDYATRVSQAIDRHGTVAERKFLDELKKVGRKKDFPSYFYEKNN